MDIIQSIKDTSFVNKLLLPGGGTNYYPSRRMHGHNLIWLRTKTDRSFPNLWIPRQSEGVLLYSHGNGGTLKDWYSLLRYYSEKFSMSVLGVEYPGYGPAEGVANETSVNENVFAAYEFLLSVGYPHQNIVIMGYSIGTGPSIQLASELCSNGRAPGALITVAGFTSVRDIVTDLKGMHLISVLAPIILMERWDSQHNVQSVTCPSMFIHGQRDQLIPWEHSSKLHELCPSHEKLLHLCPKADHCRFREPSDTVDPISTFLRLYFQPVRVGVIDISAEYFTCPESMIEKEKAMLEESRARDSKGDKRKLKNREMYSKSPVSTEDEQCGSLLCLDVSPVMSFFNDFSQAITNSATTAGNVMSEVFLGSLNNGNGVPTVTDDITRSDNTLKGSDNVSIVSVESSTMEEEKTTVISGNGNVKLKDGFDNEHDNENAETVIESDYMSCFHSDPNNTKLANIENLFKPNSSEPSYSMDISNTSNKSSARSQSGSTAGGETVSNVSGNSSKSSKKPFTFGFRTNINSNNNNNISLSDKPQTPVDPTIAAISTFFKSYNNHDINGILSVLDDRIVTVYPDSQLNWSTHAMATSHFQKIFHSNTYITAEYRIKMTRNEKQTTSITLKCKYSDVVDCYDANYRDMEVVVHKGKIVFLSYSV